MLLLFHLGMTSNSVRSTRWQSQVDAVSVIHSAKMRVHPQSAVGLMSMGGKGPEVLSTFTSDFGAILAGLHQTKIHGTSHLSSSIQVAAVSSPRPISKLLMTDLDDILVGPQAPYGEVPTPTHRRILMLPYRRR
jgi:hypothetical protein